MIRKQKIFVACLAMLFTLVTSSLLIADDDDHEKARRLEHAGTILPLEVIVKKAQSIHPGRILEVELDTKHGQYLYEIELLDDSGQVWEMKFNSQTGQLLKQKQEN